MKKKRKVVRYRKRLHINIGVVIFAFVLVYFLIYLISYLTANHISIYEVQKGQIAKNTVYTGLVLRTEEVCYAEESGDINYYKKESDKAGYNDLVCSIDKNGNISKEISEAGLDGNNLSQDELIKIQSDITEYSGSYSNMQFYNIYSFKESINAKIQENLYISALNSLSEQTSTAVSQNTFSFIRAKTDGVLAFYTDGYEDVTPDNFQADMYNPSSYTKNNLKSNTSVVSGQALYKAVTEEDWHIMVPITEEEVAFYQNEMSGGQTSFVIHLIFKKDGTETNPTATIKTYGSQSFLQLDLNNSMVRFLSDRYLEIGLGSDNVKGLKIPNSAITEKEFLVIPKEYVGKGDDSSGNGVLKVTTDNKNKEKIEFISTELYYETEDAYYVDEENLAIGDTLQLQGSSEQYTIKDKANLQGVYNVNKGYAVFKQIEILAQNEEYTIIKTGTSYGVSLYDHIALDGTSVKEGEFAN